MVVTDGENDYHSVSSDITILNRNPEIILLADSDTIPVLSPITFEITERIDQDTQTPDAPVDILWNAPCEQGTTLGIKCTVTLDQEGPYTIQVDATDDDGATITEEYMIEVTNIAPYNPEWEVKFEGNRLIPNSFGLYTVNEGDQLTIRGWAQDSENDMSSLRHVWAPDAEEKPDLEIIQQNTAISQIEAIYETDGQHIATFQVFDDDDESTDLMTVPFRVNNVEPTIRPFSQPLPVAEDQNIEMSIIADDTLNDLDTLVPCYDLDPSVNSDNQGSEIDDCDIESFNLIYSWPDSNTAPEKIVFHVTDNDGAVASVNINIDVRNKKPSVGIGSPSDYNPISGDLVILTGNGTTDSLYDMENMIYSWDMDISKDSDGDGDKTNDEDILGKIVEWQFNNEGSIVVQLTVDDGDTTNSMRITIQVEEKPFTITSFIISPIGVLIVIVLILSLVAAPVIMKKRKETEHDEYRVPSKGTIDDAFDDPDYDPFSEDRKKQKISKKRIKEKQNKPVIKNNGLDKDLLLDDDEKVSDNQVGYIDLEDKNLAVNEVLSASEIEELIGEEE
tara:strand:- start:466 stop:2148 length:1683 start_codon:yes stop_codon:yes gene_type:complete